MQIYYKPIKLKKHEWLPQERIYNNKFWLLDIIKDEELDKDMICVQNVGFDSNTQTFTNVEITCTSYNDEFIYYVKADNVSKDQQYFWTYITSKQYDTRLKIQLELTIDVISSNFDNFDNEKFRGKFYIDRTTEKSLSGINVWREINNIHSDVCNNIDNPIQQIIRTDILVNNNIDVFVDNKLEPTARKVINVPTEEGKFQGGVVDITEKGNVLLESADIKKQKFLAYKSTVSLNEKFKDTYDINFYSTIQQLLIKYGSEQKYEEQQWYFPTPEQGQAFFNEIFLSDDRNDLFKNTDNISNDQKVNFWLSVPKIFNVGNDVISDFQIETIFPDINIKVTQHEQLHYNYYLDFQNLLKIPLDLQKLFRHGIYGTRIINNDGVIFKFYYNDDRINEFYNVNLSLTNGLLTDEYVEYQRNLNSAYNSGLKGPRVGLENFTNDLISNTFGFSLGKGFGLFSLGSTLVQLPFNLYKEYKNDEYQKNLILTKPRDSKNILLLEALNEILYISSIWVNFGSIVQIVPTDNPRPSYVILNSTNTISRSNNLQLKLLIEKPSDDDIKKITDDQTQFGPIVNQLFLDIPNPLYINRVNEESYFQGKIQPNFNPVNNFMLDLINTILAQGIRIRNNEPEPTNDNLYINGNDVENQTISIFENEQVNFISNNDIEITGDTNFIWSDLIKIIALSNDFDITVIN